MTDSDDASALGVAFFLPFFVMFMWEFRAYFLGEKTGCFSSSCGFPLTTIRG